MTFTGLRAGEKLHEEFVGPGERLTNRVGALLRVVEGAGVEHDLVHAAMAQLGIAVRARDHEGVMQVVARLVPEYRSTMNPDVARTSSLVSHHA